MSWGLAAKAYREHGGGWWSMAGISVLALGGVAFLDAPEQLRDPARQALLVGAAAVLAWIYGMVCGATLLADRKEDTTPPPLEGPRPQIWREQCLTGVALVLALVVVELALCVGLLALAARVPGLLAFAEATVAVVTAGILGLGWGLLFSPGSTATWQAIGQSVAAQVPCAAVLLFVLYLTGGTQDPAVGVIWPAAVALTMVPFVASHQTFCRPQRRTEDGLLVETVIPEVGWRQVCWMTWEQARPLARVLPPVSLILGLGLLLGGALLWPALTLVLGLVCGVTVFADEQAIGSFRFLGEQRFPPGRIWLVKTTVRLLMAAAAALLALTPCVVRALIEGTDAPASGILARLFHDNLLALLMPPATFLTIWVLYGFCIGQLCGMLFRKVIVAAVIALGGAVVAASLWLPALAGGGLRLWQVAPVPLLALVASRWTFSAWLAGRLGVRTTLLPLSACAAAAMLWLVAVHAYRAIEVPNTSEPVDLAAFDASLPPLEKNKAGGAVRGACEMVRVHFSPANLTQRRPTRPLFPDDRRLSDEISFADQLDQVLARGWPADNTELSEWLDKVLAGEWRQSLLDTAAEPAGPVEDLRQLTAADTPRHAEPAVQAAKVLAVHGLRAQARGYPAAFVKDLQAALVIARGLRCHGVPLCLSAARAVEATCLEALDRWLERLNGQPRQLAEVAALLHHYGSERIDDPEDTLCAQYKVARNSLDRLEECVMQCDLLTAQTLRVSRAAAVAVARRLLWESERQHRLLRLVPRGQADVRDVLLPPGSLGPDLRPRLEEAARRDRAALRAGELKVALRRYEIQHRAPAEDLDALVPEFLDRIPEDPYDGKPFRYRLSAGEPIAWPDDTSAADAGLGRTAYRTAAAGQCILWSVGPDGADDGGHTQLSDRGRPAAAADLIFLVPLPPKKNAEGKTP
jgi:hypothetical protein